VIECKHRKCTPERQHVYYPCVRCGQEKCGVSGLNWEYCCSCEQLLIDVAEAAAAYRKARLALMRLSSYIEYEERVRLQHAEEMAGKELDAALIILRKEASE